MNYETSFPAAETQHVTSAEHRPPIAWHWRVCLLGFSLTYGLILQALPLMAFKDRANYFDYASDPAGILAVFVSQGALAVLANEPLWLVINMALGWLGSPEFVMRSVIFIGAARFSYVFLRADPKNIGWLMLFLLMPQILKNFITHLRQGLALAVFFSGYFAGGQIRRWTLIAAAPFIHASYVFVLPVVILPAVLRRMRLAVDIQLLAIGGYALAASLSLGILATLVGARQLENYNFTMTDVSGLGFAFWVGVLGLFVLEGKSFLNRHQEAAGILLFYLLSYFFIEVTSRIFESGMPFVCLAGLALSDWRRWAFINSFLLYSAIQWFMRLLTPMPF